VVQQTFPPYSSSRSKSASNPVKEFWKGLALPQQWQIWLASGGLVIVPVFFQAPLVRLFPELSFVMTLFWIGLSLLLMRQPWGKLWGDLCLGFSWSWLAGSIYWGWLRWEPVYHLPIEAIALPFVLLDLVLRCRRSQNSWGLIGHFFYLGSLLGTAITDIYFYLVNLIPHWRQLMQVEPEFVRPVFQEAIAQIYTPWGACWAGVLVMLLLLLGLLPLRSKQIQWWAFSGAVLSTLVVDGLFWVAAVCA